MQKPPVEDVIRILIEQGLDGDAIASTIAKMFGSAGDEVAKVADEVIPPKAPKSASVIPKLVEEGAPLPAAQKIAAAGKPPKFVRPSFDDAVHSNTDEKFSDIMSKEEFDAASDRDLKFTRNSRAHAYATEQKAVVGRAEKLQKKNENKAAFAATRTPEARREAAAAKAEYFKKYKKDNK
jgi:hypothetical protein